MQSPTPPRNESERLKSLLSLNVLDTPVEYRFDRITQLLSKTFDVPIALVSLIDANRQWFKSCVGLDVRETPREISFCGHAILDDEVFVIENTLEDQRFADNPLVTDAPKIRFYAGCPLKHADGNNLGTLCLIDRKPRTFSKEDKKALKEFATLVELELIQQQSTSIDKQSGLNNQQGFKELAIRSIAVNERMNMPVSLAFLYVSGLTSIKKTLNMIIVLILLQKASKRLLKAQMWSQDMTKTAL